VRSHGFDLFFADNYAAVVRALAVATGDPMAAEEMAQEAFARALRRWRDVASMDRPATWVYVVAVREFGRQRRHRSYATDRQRLLASSIEAPPDPAAALDEHDRLARLVNELAPRQRMAVVLRFYADLSLAEVADAMDCAVGTAKATIHAALAHLRVHLGSEDDR
jgi:RNA polymerase sigma-70 factor (ECF subfamily)